LGVTRFIRFAAHRELRVTRPVAERLVSAARDALPTRDAVIARRVLAADLELLVDLDQQITRAEQELAELVPASPFRTMTSVPGWGTTPPRGTAATVRANGSGRRPRHRRTPRGPHPMQYESAGRRRDGGISREGSVELRRALIDLGIGLWHSDQPARAYAAGLRARGKHGGIIACALAHRANRIAFALTRDRATYDPTRWA
jgi:transposase